MRPLISKSESSCSELLIPNAKSQWQPCCVPKGLFTFLISTGKIPDSAQDSQPRPCISFWYIIRELFLTKLFNQVKRNNEGQTAFKEMVSLIEEPGNDLKVLESTMKSIRDPTWYFPRNRASPRLQLEAGIRVPAKRTCFTWSVHIVTGAVPSLSKCILESAPVGVLKCCLWVIYLKITFMVLPNEIERRLVDSNIFFHQW